MKPMAIEWVKKAEQDFRAIERLSSGTELLHEGVCFHAQQCAEKYMKAVLQARSIVFPKTHELPVLLELMVPPEPQLRAMQKDLENLSQLAVDIRYPGSSATVELAQEAARLSGEVRRICRELLALDDEHPLFTPPGDG